jgi:hypothetical protein
LIYRVYSLAASLWTHRTISSKRTATGVCNVTAVVGTGFERSPEARTGTNWSWTQRETPSFDDPVLEVAGCLRGEVLII